MTDKINLAIAALRDEGAGVAEPVAWPKVWGTSRMFDNEKALLICFDRKPTDAELSAFDDAIKGAAHPAQPAGKVRVTEAAGCIAAAYAEGWPDALADGDIERIRDLWNRRLSFVLPALEAALAAQPKE